MFQRREGSENRQYVVRCERLDAKFHIFSRFLCNSGKLSLVPYTKDFGRITHF